MSLGQLLKLAFGLGNYLTNHVFPFLKEELQGKKEVGFFQATSWMFKCLRSLLKWQAIR
jgi:hypothetical protein